MNNRVKFKGKLVSLVWLKRNCPEAHAAVATKHRASSKRAAERKRQEMVDAAKTGAKACGEKLTVEEARQVVKNLPKEGADRLFIAAKLAALTPRELEDRLWDVIHFHPDCESFGHQRSTRLARHIIKSLGL